MAHLYHKTCIVGAGKIRTVHQQPMSTVVDPTNHNHVLPQSPRCGFPMWASAMITSELMAVTCGSMHDGCTKLV